MKVSLREKNSVLLSRLRTIVYVPFVWLLLLLNCVASGSFGSSQDDSNPSLSDILSFSRTGPSCSGNGNFWVRNLITNSSSCTHFTKMSSGQFTDVYGSSGLETALDYGNVSQEFDTKIYPRLGDAFGYSEDIDGDGKVAILVTDIQDGAQPGGSFVAGFFDPVDFYPDNSAYPVRSNFSNILYMDGVQLVDLRNTDMLQGKPDTFLATVAHEYQHLIRFQYESRILASGGGRDETWINEGTSEVAADIAGYSPQMSRINCYRGRTSGSCARGVNGSAIFGTENFSSLVDYAFAYSFMKYLYMISGTSTTSRNSYFRNGVQGPKGNRASDSIGLFHLFRLTSEAYTTAPSDVKSILGNTDTSVFQKIYPSFVWLSLGDAVPDYAQSGTNQASANTYLQNMTRIIQYFPFPAAGTDGDFLRKLYDPQRLPEITPLSQLGPGQIQFVKADRSNANAIYSLVLLKKTWDTNLYSLQISTETKRSGDVSVSLGIAEGDEEGQEAIHLPDAKEPLPVCPHQFFKLARSRTKEKIYRAF
ncbi:peptidase M30 [Leptospira langatensis]|uniref:Peptidase M30 n=1 Tax=Leptospira langatensis TaxID=2484983 RepID=A0A5F1ZSH7_9LEPT|nr:peptidase M30 [Leptospira langatensis]TGK01861.1 peptidase M30 [Leptospira langatensis]TGL39465.1 peptidase M30 [Leptospira langatensis]